MFLPDMFGEDLDLQGKLSARLFVNHGTDLHLLALR